MFPFLVLGPIRISLYAAAYVVMAVLIGFYGYLRLSRLPYPPALLGNVMLLGVSAGFLGAFVPFILPTLDNFRQSGHFIWIGRASVLWTIACGSAAAAVYLKLKNLPLGPIFDQGGLPLPLGQAIGRLGCLAAGCCGGIETSSWIGLYLPDEFGKWSVRYPVQILSGLGDLAIFLGLLFLERTIKQRGWKLFPGALYLLYIMLYAVKRYFIQFWRVDYAAALGVLSWPHIYVVAGFCMAAGLLVWGLLRQNQPVKSL